MPQTTALLIGCGTVGSTTARLLLEDLRFQRIIVADIDLQRAVRLAEALDGPVTAVQLDCRQEDQVVEALAGVSVVLNAAGPFSRDTLADTLSLMRTVVEAKIPYADVNDDLAALQTVFESEYLDSLARHRGVGVLPGLGASPGQTNVVARYMAGRMDVVEEVRFFLVEDALVEDGICPSETVWPISANRPCTPTAAGGPRRRAGRNIRTLHSRPRGVPFVVTPWDWKR